MSNSNINTAQKAGIAIFGICMAGVAGFVLYLHGMALSYLAAKLPIFDSGYMKQHLGEAIGTLNVLLTFGIHFAVYAYYSWKIAWKMGYVLGPISPGIFWQAATSFFAYGYFLTVAHYCGQGAVFYALAVCGVVVSSAVAYLLAIGSAVDSIKAMLRFAVKGLNAA